MFGLIRKLLQLAVFLAIGFVVIRPQVLPPPVQPIAYGAQRFVFGNEVSWNGFTANWQEKWRFITTTIPVLGTMVTAPEPQPITADGVMKLIIETILVRPVAKWNAIKAQLWEKTTVQEATPSAQN